MMESIQIPTLLFWENGNSWFGSLGRMRFFARPEQFEGTEGKQLAVQVWRGPLAMEHSQVLASAAFPVTEEGLVRAAAWLEEQAAGMGD